jgi:hypothetical protein
VIRRASVASYLQALAAACLEASRDFRLLGVLVGVLKLAPRTILELPPSNPQCTIRRH